MVARLDQIGTEGAREPIVCAHDDDGIVDRLHEQRGARRLVTLLDVPGVGRWIGAAKQSLEHRQNHG